MLSINHSTGYTLSFQNVMVSKCWKQDQKIAGQTPNSATPTPTRLYLQTGPLPGSRKFKPPQLLVWNYCHGLATCIT